MAISATPDSIHPLSDYTSFPQHRYLINVPVYDRGDKKERREKKLIWLRL